MIIVAAQTIPHREDTARNLEDHYRLIRLAADNGAQLIVFPEMSITGYEREQAGYQPFTRQDARLRGLKNLASERNIIILAGAPILLETGLHIGMYILYPDQSEAIYTKQYLHDGEENFFVAGKYCDTRIKLEDDLIAVAICADIANPAHPAAAAQGSSSIYIASIFYTPNGIGQGLSDLQTYARRHRMNILMSNFGGHAYGMDAAGWSAFWGKDGSMIGAYEGSGEGLLIAKKEYTRWTIQLLKTDES